MSNMSGFKKHARGHTGVFSSTIPVPEVRYMSGTVVYVESLIEEKWIGRYWSADSRINLLQESLPAEAFHLKLNDRILTTGWKWQYTTEAPPTERGARHIAVELSNTESAVDLKLHTLLDGIPVLTRWLEITNHSCEHLPLNEISPWCGQLWLGENFAAGHFALDGWACEGWFEWMRLPKGITEISSTKGQGHDAPFFILRNEVTGQYFIGHLAWAANWMIHFVRKN
ncbi:hypothetical protein JXJ21_02790 [candidate division KSB1 bacterium]|nr:hypothetical protein [candidate division KSB1 bacterium]